MDSWKVVRLDLKLLNLFDRDLRFTPICPGIFATLA